MPDFPSRNRADWETLVRQELKGAGADSLTWLTPEGIAVKPLYTAADIEGLDLAGDRKSTRLNSSHT